MAMCTATTDALESAVKAIQGHKFLFEKQVNHWVGHQEDPTIQDDRTEKLDVRGLLLANPRNMEAELKFHKDLFNKLKFNFLELSTKERFLRRLLASPVQWCTESEIAESEKRIKELKTGLKAYKKETELQHAELAVLVDQVCKEHEDLIKATHTANELRERIGPLVRDLEPSKVFIPFYQEADIASLLTQFDPNKKTLDELTVANDELRGPVETLRDQLQGLESQISAAERERAESAASLALVRDTRAHLELKVAEARAAVQTRDPNLDAYLVWCQQWTQKLLALQGVADVCAIDAATLHVRFVPDALAGAVLEVRVESNASMLHTRRVRARVLPGASCGVVDVEDIVSVANRILEDGGARGEGVVGAVRVVVQEVRGRVECLVKRGKEKAALEAVEGLHVCWDDDSGLVEVGVEGGENGEGRIVQVKLDGGYPAHVGCMQVMEVLPNGGKGKEVIDLQDKIEEAGILTVTQLIEALKS
ncbi:hypothetical protein BC830DRAFT_1079031 [Chytriomyces sp. MP71]|nr:hypothetical protein BC830DRAFT_1079031 [Chytriomyces sp. MP71]